MQHERNDGLLRTVYAKLHTGMGQLGAKLDLLRSKLRAGAFAHAVPLMGVLVTFSWNSGNPPGFVREFKLYKGASIATLAPIQTITVVGNQTDFSTTYDFTDSAPQYFGVSAVNNFGESVVVTKDGSGNDVKLGKPSAPISFSFSAP